MSFAVGFALVKGIVHFLGPGYGARLAVEGLAKGEGLSGKRVVIVEDVTTTGSSALKAVEAVRDAGGEVALVFTMIDREEGDRNLRAGRPCVSLALQGQRILEGVMAALQRILEIAVQIRPFLRHARP